MKKYKINGKDLVIDPDNLIDAGDYVYDIILRKFRIFKDLKMRFEVSDKNDLVTRGISISLREILLFLDLDKTGQLLRWWIQGELLKVTDDIDSELKALDK